LRVFHNANVATGYPYAEMLRSLWKNINESVTNKSICARFARGVEIWFKAQIQQGGNRALSQILTIEKFILMRREAFGAAMVEAMVEYSVDIQVPDEVFKDPTVRAMLEAIHDLMAWPNDICSFNKEQADGDYQNLVYCIMLEKGLDLQSAIDFATDMVRARVKEYVNLKSEVPSFGSETDEEVARFIKALEHWVQGSVVWYYESPRYFRDIDISVKNNLMVPLMRHA